MTDFDELSSQLGEKLAKALAHLAYTYKKILVLPDEYTQLDDEQMETWESFSARFSRVADIFLTRYVRVRVLQEDPGFSGTLRDYLNQAEKIGFIDNAEEWLAIRELRNLIAHEYVEENLSRYLRLLKEQTPKLLNIERLLKKQ